MRSIFIIVILCLILLQANAQRGTIEGKISFENVPNIRGSIVAKGLRKGTITDNTGCFIFNLPVGYHNIEISVLGYTTKYINVNVVKDSTIFLQVTFLDSCSYYLKHNHDTVCPVCGRKNKVIPIVYGLPIGELARESYYYAGCVVTDCDPMWFCKRDQQKF
jgi:hypothetical protein